MLSYIIVCNALIFIYICVLLFFFFFFQAEDGIRDYKVTGVQTCALPILRNTSRADLDRAAAELGVEVTALGAPPGVKTHPVRAARIVLVHTWLSTQTEEIGRASCRERV